MSTSQGYSSTTNTSLSEASWKELHSEEHFSRLLSSYFSTPSSPDSPSAPPILTADRPFEYDGYFGPNAMIRTEQRMEQVAQAQEALWTCVEQSPLGIGCLTPSQYSFAFDGPCWSSDLWLFRQQMADTRQQSLHSNQCDLENIEPANFSKVPASAAPQTAPVVRRPMQPVMVQQQPSLLVRQKQPMPLRKNQKAAPVDNKTKGPEMQRWMAERNRGFDADLRKQQRKPVKRPLTSTPVERLPMERLQAILNHEAPPAKMARHDTTARREPDNRQIIIKPQQKRTAETAKVLLAPPIASFLSTPPCSVEHISEHSPNAPEDCPDYSSTHHGYTNSYRVSAPAVKDTLQDATDCLMGDDLLETGSAGYLPMTRLPSTNTTFGAFGINYQQ